MQNWPRQEEIVESLSQQLAFHSNDFALTKEGVYMRQKRWGKVTQFFAPFEEVGGNMVIEKREWWLNSFPIGLVAYVVFKIVTADDFEIEWKVIYVLAVFSVVYFIYLLLEAGAHQSIIGGNFTLRFFYDTPSKSEVDQFITKIFTYRKELLLAHYGKIDRNRDPRIQLEQFSWLRNQGVLTEQEFQDLRNELVSGGKSAPIGFTSSN